MNKETIKKELSFLCPVPELLKMKAEVVGRTITRKDLSFFYEGAIMMIRKMYQQNIFIQAMIRI